jgi:histidinol-phosphate phosphatase family protein
LSNFTGVVFIDRDGVINHNRNDYVKCVDEFVFLPGVLIALSILHKNKMAVVVVSNQAGVAKGIISTDDLARIDSKLQRCVEETGGNIDGIYYCTHKPEDKCNCRKPEPGLIIRARKDLDLGDCPSYLVGDALSDICAGMNTGCTTVFVLSGRTSIHEVESWDQKPDHIADDLLAAVDWIIHRR